MAAFEFGNYAPHAAKGHRAHPSERPGVTSPETAHRPPSPTIQEPVLTMKIYDSCRSKDCLSRHELGPARSLCGKPIKPPHGALSATIEDLEVARIVVLKKEPSPFRKGYWDVELQYVFDYDIKFYATEGRELEKIPATNSFTRRVSLFGSEAKDVSLFTDLLGNGETLKGHGAPNLMVEAKAIALTADVTRKHCGHEHFAHDHDGEEHEHHAHGHGHHSHKQVFVTIGLFSIVKLYRLVSLLVESRGFVVPPQCANVMPPNPCDFFDTLHFPMDSFAPPQKKEFKEGLSLNIAPEARCEGTCDGGCSCAR